MKPNELDFKENDMGEEKEILKMLHIILREQYISDPASRTIIFVTTRRLAQYLSHHLNTVKIVDGTSRAVGFVTSNAVFFFRKIQSYEMFIFVLQKM